ncbi:MAG: complex I NDUFA9 subunit family protein [Phycisphaerales bacterium]|nr:complex I NDUFA9 subunit family protein [Phycisphaerales bacterium]
MTNAMTEEQDVQTEQKTQEGAEERPFLTRVLVTGGSGFVGRAVVRELIARGHKPVCLVRDRLKLTAGLPEVPDDRLEMVAGDLFDDDALAQAAHGAEAVVHLVGIIAENRMKKQTFERVHFEGTQRVVDACKQAGVKRYVHMSALGTRTNAVSEYHRTKWAAENYVRGSGLDWTIFRPSIIHGPEGEFMRLMKAFMCDLTIPVIAYFGDGQNKLQPVSVKDVAHCFIAALSMQETIGQVYELGGPEAMTWKELYRTCRDLIPDAKRWKPMISQPVWAAKLTAMTVMKLPILPRMMRFNVGQVQMSQEDSVCGIEPVEKTFGIRLRDFREELAAYAAQID